MVLLTIKCPSCATDGTISFLNPDYEGPYKCWKCHDLFSISIQKGQLMSWQPLSEEELQSQQEAEALRKRLRGHSSDED